MLFRLSADLVLLVHFVFVAFVVLGGLLVLRWPRLRWAHLPAVAWGALIEFAGWVCPLTPLEVLLRRRGGEAGYSGDFIDHYLAAALSPRGWPAGFRSPLGRRGWLGTRGVMRALLVVER